MYLMYIYLISIN